MAPEQCPACGRFLSRAFVAEATPGPRPCPRCDHPVSFAVVPDDGDATPADAPVPDEAPAPDEPPAPDAGDATPAPAAPAARAGVSPDAREAAEPQPTGHPLDAWGSGATAPPMTDGPGLGVTPEELALTGGGALLGALVVRRSRLLGALVGAVAAVLSLLARRR